MEPESIVTHRKSGNKVQYKVHWRGLGNEEETWVNAEDFLNKGILKVYWTYHLDPNNQPKGSGRRKYVPEYIQQFYRDYIQNPLIEFPDFQPEVEKSRTERPKPMPEVPPQQHHMMMMPDQYYNQYPEDTNLMNDNNISFENAKIIGYEPDPSGSPKVFKLRLGNGSIVSISRLDAFMKMPQTINSYLEEISGNR